MRGSGRQVAPAGASLWEDAAEPQPAAGNSTAHLSATTTQGSNEQ